MFRQNDRYGASAKPSPGLLAGRLHVGLCAAQLADRLLLLLPGFFTDFLGLLLLLPPVQKHLTMKLMPHLRFSRMPGGGFSAGTGGGETFEGEFQRKDEQRDRLDHKDDRRD